MWAYQGVRKLFFQNILRMISCNLWSSTLIISISNFFYLLRDCITYIFRPLFKKQPNLTDVNHNLSLFDFRSEAQCEPWNKVRFLNPLKHKVKILKVYKETKKLNYSWDLQNIKIFEDLAIPQNFWNKKIHISLWKTFTNLSEELINSNDHCLIFTLLTKIHEQQVARIISWENKFSLASHI